MPTATEILIASDCRKCRRYFNKTGPVCKHCDLEELILKYQQRLLAFKSKKKILVSLGEKGPQGGKKENGHRLGGVSTDDAFAIEEKDAEQVDGAFIMIVKHLRAYTIRLVIPRGKENDEESLDIGMMKSL
jgi:hypothetical protein